MTKRFEGFIICFLLYFIFAPTKVDAAQAILSFTPETDTVVSGQTISATIIVNTSGDSINRVLTKIQYPAGYLVPESIDTSESFVDLWYQNSIGTGNGELILEGGITGNGISGNQLVFAKINFTTQNAGVGQLIYGNDSAVYRDSDGVNILGEARTATYTITDGSVTPTQSPTPTPQTTPTPSPTPLLTPTVTPTPLASLPKGGVSSPTIILLSLTGLMSTIGLIIVKRS